jgi:hypothetical protein
MRAAKTSLIALLRAARRGGGGEAIQDLDPGQVRWAAETGLGPLLRRITPPESPLTGTEAWPLVLGADLAARVASADQLDAAAEILRACRGRVPPLTLLKGLSLCAREYPEPHLRPMRDLDLLVDLAAVPEVEEILLGLGYVRDAPADGYRGHHHVAPFVHRRTNVYVEVHHGLFRPDSALGADPIFGPEAIAREQLDTRLRGQPARRLSVELQIVYLAAHWASSRKLLAGPGGLLPLLDLVYLIERNDVRWPLVLDWLEGSAAAPSVYALLAYGARRGVLALPYGVLPGLRQRQRAFNRVNLALAFFLIDRCMVAGRPLARPLGRSGLDALWTALFLAGPPLANLGRVPLLVRRRPRG